jgi:hypothetical protein
VLTERLDGVRVEGDPALLVGLSVLLPHLGTGLGDAALEHYDSVPQIQVPPPQAAQLAAPGASGHG